MKVWITKYALTKGIFEIEVDPPTDGFPNMVDWRRNTGFDQTFHGEGSEWHRTHDAAVKRAVDMREARIQSLKRQLEKLEAMTF